MPFHLAAFSESQLDDGVLQAQAAVPDNLFFTAGDDLRIPDKMNWLLGGIAMIGPEAAALRARFVSPSMRGFINPEIIPAALTELPGSNQHIHRLHVEDPTRLEVGEALNFESDGGGNGAAAIDVTGLAFLGDGSIVRAGGDIRTVRATTTITTIQRQWVSGPITFSEDLPAGTYAVVGARFQDTNLGAGRLIFTGSIPRPGTLACADGSNPDVHGSRFGGWGIWGTFDINQPPQAEFLSLGGTDTNPVLFLDIMRVG